MNTGTILDLIYRLKERARIRRRIESRKSVQEGKPDKIADLLDEAADALFKLTGRRTIDGKGECEHEWEEAKTDPYYKTRAFKCIKCLCIEYNHGY